jgi:ribonuclease HI/pterin-4a-carbinolamine dehydratase
MWQETKHGLYKQFNFENFKEAWAFMEKVAALAEKYQHHPRWENEWSVVQIWLITHEGGKKITGKDHELAEAIDAVAEGMSPEKAVAAEPDAHPDEVKIFTDGGSRGNPGPSASGFVIMDMEDNLLVERGEYLGVTTNNVAEYTALKHALEECRTIGVRQVHAYLDSLLVVNQMNGIFKIKNRDLWPIHDAIKKLAASFDKVEFSHVPREFNKLADAEVNKALDAYLGAGNSSTEVV